MAFIQFHKMPAFLFAFVGAPHPFGDLFVPSVPLIFWKRIGDAV